MSQISLTQGWLYSKTTCYLSLFSGPSLSKLKKSLEMAMKKDFLPYKKMKDIFMETTGRDPITWGVATGKLWVIRLAFNSGTVY